MKIVLFAAISIFSGLHCAPLMSGEVIDLKNGLTYGKNDGVPKRVTTDGKRVLVLHAPKSAFPLAGAPFGKYSGSSISPKLNDAAQNALYFPGMESSLTPDNYSGPPDQIWQMYEYYINIPYQVEPK